MCHRFIRYGVSHCLHTAMTRLEEAVGGSSSAPGVNGEVSPRPAILALGYMSSLSLLTAICLGLYARWEVSQAEGHVFLVTLVLALAVLGLAVVLYCYFHMERASLALLHLWLGFLLGLLSFVDGPALDRDVKERATDYLLLTSIVLRTMWALLERVCGCTRYRPAFLTSAERLELTGFTLASLMVGDGGGRAQLSVPVVVALVGALAVVMVALRMKAVLALPNLVCFVAVTTTLLFLRSPDGSTTTAATPNPFALACFFSQLVCDPLLDVYFSGLSVTERWQPFLAGRGVRRLSLLLLLLLAEPPGVLHHRVGLPRQDRRVPARVLGPGLGGHQPGQGHGVPGRAPLLHHLAAAHSLHAGVHRGPRRAHLADPRQPVCQHVPAGASPGVPVPRALPRAGQQSGGHLRGLRRGHPHQLLQPRRPAPAAAARPGAASEPALHGHAERRAAALRPPPGGEPRLRLLHQRRGPGRHAGQAARLPGAAHGRRPAPRHLRGVLQRAHPPLWGVGAGRRGHPAAGPDPGLVAGEERGRLLAPHPGAGRGQRPPLGQGGERPLGPGPLRGGAGRHAAPLRPQRPRAPGRRAAGRLHRPLGGVQLRARRRRPRLVGPRPRHLGRVRRVAALGRLRPPPAHGRRHHQALAHALPACHLPRGAAGPVGGRPGPVGVGRLLWRLPAVPAEVQAQLVPAGGPGHRPRLQAGQVLTAPACLWWTEHFWTHGGAFQFAPCDARLFCCVILLLGLSG